MTDEGHLLVTCFVQPKFRLFTEDGSLIRDIELPDDITCPWHAIKLLKPDHYLVFHASTTDSGYRLSVSTVYISLSDTIRYDTIQDVFRATVVAKVTYCAPAWSGNLFSGRSRAT